MSQARQKGSAPGGVAIASKPWDSTTEIAATKRSPVSAGTASSRDSPPAPIWDNSARENCREYRGDLVLRTSTPGEPAHAVHAGARCLSERGRQDQWSPPAWTNGTRGTPLRARYALSHPLGSALFCCEDLGLGDFALYTVI